MNQSQGTPKTLREAISNGLSTYRPNTGDRMDEHVENHVRDFLAQKFGTVILEASNEQAIDLKRLFLALIKRG